MAQAWFGRTERPYRFASPFAGREFALLLVVGDEDISADEQWALSQEFVRQGCRYAVCFGHRCSTWDDAIDMVGVMSEIEGRATPFVMTSWHEREPLDEVVEFLECSTSFGDWVPEHFAVLIVGGSKRLEEDTRAAVRRRFTIRSA